jgi:hypothetical protein
MASVLVYNTETMEEQIFNCPAAEAVVCAHEQSRKNFNTWNYDFSQARTSFSGDLVKCGKYAAVAR